MAIISSVPILLPYGFVGVYGIGNSVGVTGLQTTNIELRFATIYFIGVDMDSGIIGNSVLYNPREEVCRLAWDNYPYPILYNNKIIGTEAPPA